VNRFFVAALIHCFILCRSRRIHRPPWLILEVGGACAFRQRPTEPDQPSAASRTYSPSDFTQPLPYAYGKRASFGPFSCREKGQIAQQYEQVPSLTSPIVIFLRKLSYKSRSIKLRCPHANGRCAGAPGIFLTSRLPCRRTCSATALPSKSTAPSILKPSTANPRRSSNFTQGSSNQCHPCCVSGRKSVDTPLSDDNRSVHDAHIATLIIAIGDHRQIGLVDVVYPETIRRM